VLCSECAWQGQHVRFHPFRHDTIVEEKMLSDKQIELFSAGEFADNRLKKRRMYDNIKTWNPAVGCRFDCIYCRPSFQKIVAWSTRRRGEDCEGCLKYAPHEHPKRLSSGIPGKEIIFVFGTGDISFYRKAFVKQAIERLIDHLSRAKKSKTVYLQSKNPKCFNNYLDDLKPIKYNVILATTLETNRDKGYSDISKAPLPSIRYKDFLALDWERKIITIEPVMDFDLDEFVGWIRAISPEAVYLGFNSRPNEVQLPEPSMDKFWQLRDMLSSFTEVKLKDTRGHQQ